MSPNQGNTVEMTCADFERVFDRYIDGVLEGAEAEAAGMHVAACPPCDLEVTRWQQTSVLLSTAVADFATAVDVSSLRRDVEAALGFSDDAAPARRSEQRPATFDGGRQARRAARRSSGSSRLGGAVRFLSAASVSAAVAAAAVLVLTPATQTATTTGSSPRVVASAPSREASAPATFRTASLRPRARGLQAQAEADAVAAVAHTPPPLARPDTSHVDGLEAAPGHLVSTWVQPRTNTRVIWIDDSAMGAPVRTAGLDR